MSAGMEMLNTMSPDKALELDIQIIVALMRRLGVTEVDIKPDELLSPAKLDACGLAIVTTPEGGYIVTMLDMSVADAMIEANGGVRH